MYCCNKKKLELDLPVEQSYEARKVIERYGKLLLCPVCNQLLTHPVLLPCQHSVCYGCARSQILAQEENSSFCETPTNINGSRNISTPNNEKISRRLTSTPSESSLLQRTPNSSKNGIDASPSLPIRSGSSLSECSHHTSISTKDAGYESSLSDNHSTANKKKSRASQIRSTLPKFYSSPKRTNSRRLNTSQSTSLISSSSHEKKFESPDQKQHNSTQETFDVTLESDISCRSINCVSTKNSPTCLHNGMSSSTRTPPQDVMNSYRESVSGGLRRSTSASIVTGRFSFRSNQRRETNVFKKSKVTALFCPSCENAVQLGKLGIKGLFRNFALESIVDRFRTAARAAEAIRCGYCKPPASDATRSCLDCKLSYCNQCYKSVHVWGTKKAQHEFVGPTSNFSRPKVMLCPEHGNEAITMYCNQCQHSVCKICKSRGTHSKHSTISVKNAYKKNKAQLHSLLDELKNKEVETRAEIQQYEDNVRLLELEEANVRDEIHSAVDEMHKLLETKRTQLLEAADRAARTKEKELRRSLQNLKDDVLYTSVMTFAEEVLLETDPAYFLQTFKMVEMRTREAINHMSQNPFSSNRKIDHSPFRELFYSEREIKLRSLLPIYIDLEKLKESMKKWDLLQIPSDPVATEVSIPRQGNEAMSTRDTTWKLSESNAATDYFQLSFWNEDSNSVEIESNSINGTEFQIPLTSKLLDNHKKSSVKVRAANKAGVGPWSEPSVLSPHFLKRKSFEMIRLQYRQLLDVIYNENNVKLRKSLNTTTGKEFILYRGDIEFDTWGKYYWEIEATGAPDFQFFFGVVNSDLSEPTDLFEEKYNDSSALFLIGPRTCGMLEFSNERISEDLSCKKTSTKIPVTSAFKPFKKLKHSLLRHSSLTMSTGDLRSKNENNRRGSNTSETSLPRSPSVTSLPSILRPEHSTNPIGVACWNMRSTVGRRYFRIGVDLELVGDDVSKLSFLDVTGDVTTVLDSKTIAGMRNIKPVFGISGDGGIILV